MKIKKANNFVFFILRLFVKPILYLKIGVRFLKKSKKKIKRPCVIICNHSMFHDQFIIGTSFKFAINFVASDSLFREGFKSSLLKSIARPIPIKKGAADPAAVKNIMSVIRQGGSVALFPEGNRTFYGETSFFKPTIGRLVKALKVPLVISRIEGGFNSLPRWREKRAKGKVLTYVSRVIEPDEMATLSDEELNNTIKDELYFNEFDFNRKAKLKYKGKYKAQYLETALFACPECKDMTALKSEGNDFFCQKCGMRVRLNDYGLFDRINVADSTPDNIADFSKIQLKTVKATDFSQYTDKPIFSDNNVTLYKCEKAKDNEFIQTDTISLFSDRITVGDKEFKIKSITDMAVQGVYKFQVYTAEGEMYMIKAGSKRTNFMKYMICTYEIKYKTNNEEGEYYGY